MPLLGAPVQLHDVRDLEAFTRETILRHLRHGGAHLDPEAFDDLLDYLFEVSCAAATRYDPALAGKYPSFAGYLLHVQRFRIVDWYRSRFGRGGNAKRPELVSLEQLGNSPAGRRRLEQALGGGAEDVADRVEGRGWLDHC